MEKQPSIRLANLLNKLFWNFLIIIAIGFSVAGAAMAQQSESAARLAPLTGQLRLGAEYFLNRTDTEETVRRHFRLMHQYGLTVARIFIIWDDIERSRDQWDLHRYDWIYDAAQESGIKIAATLCAEDPPGWMKLTPFYHHRMNLNEPALRERSAIYIQKVVGRYRSHPAQGPWLLMNEPALEVNDERTTMQAYGKWLEQHYGTVDRLNARWFQPLQTFSDVQVDPEQWTSHWADYYSFIDWKEFNIDNLCDFLRWIRQQIWALDTTHPTHINPPSLIRNMAAGGADPWKEGETVNFLGTSIHPAWNFSEYARSEFGLPFAYCLDMLRSAAGDRPWWVTELQGGPDDLHGRSRHESDQERTDAMDVGFLWGGSTSGGVLAVESARAGERSGRVVAGKSRWRAFFAPRSGEAGGRYASTLAGTSAGETARTARRHSLQPRNVFAD